MIDVALLSVIRRWHFREGVSVREIARRTKLSRNTIAKYLANGVVQPRYAALPHQSETARCVRRPAAHVAYR